jgi:acetyl esterase/lipase
MTSPSSEGTGSIIVTHETSRAAPTSLLQSFLKPFGNRLVQPGKPQPAGSQPLAPHDSVYKTCNVRQRLVAGIRVYDINVRTARTSKTLAGRMGGSNFQPGEMEARRAHDESSAESILQDPYRWDPSPTHEGHDIISKDFAHKHPGQRKRKHIYYFCGGGWQSPPSKEHWKLCTQLAQEGTKEGQEGYSTTVSVVSYPLAPNSPAATTLPMLEKMYYSLLSPESSPEPQLNLGAPGEDDKREVLPVSAVTSRNEEIIFAGDSSGANVAICLTLLILNKDPQAPAPHTLMLISLPADLRNVNPDMPALDKHDPVLKTSFVKATARAWCGGVRDSVDKPLPLGSIPFDDPRVSPLLAMVDVLVKKGIQVHGVTGGHDVLTPDAILFRNKLDAAGVNGKWLEWDKQMHCFPLAGAGYGLPEGKKAVDWMIEVLRLKEAR